MTDEDLLLEEQHDDYGAGIVGPCDICKVRQAVIVLEKEGFKLCVLDFLNKSWIKTAQPAKGHILPFKSSTEYVPCRAAIGGVVPVVLLSPTAELKRPSALVVPEVYGITTQVLEAGVRLAHQGYEVAIPDFVRIHGVNLVTAAKLRASKILLDEVHISQSHRDRAFRILEATRKYLLTRPLVLPERQVVVGLSYGGSLALGFAAQTPSLSGVAVAYPYMIHPPSYLQNLHCPVLVVAGGGDSRTGPSLLELHRWSHIYGLNVGTMVVPDARHHFLSRAHKGYDAQKADLAWSRMMAFVRHCLSPPPVKAPPRPPVPPPVPPPARPPSSASPPTVAPTAPISPPQSSTPVTPAPAIPAPRA
jgi:dienelactone hydrolase